MWNDTMNDAFTSLATAIEATADPVNAAVRDIDAWFAQIYSKVNASNFQLLENMEPIQTTVNRKKRTKKTVEKGKNLLPEDVSPFDSVLSENGCNIPKSTRSSRAVKRGSKVSKSATELKSGISDETFSIPTRSSRAASKAACSKINSQLNLSLTKKLRRPSEGPRSEVSMEFTPTLSSTVVLPKNEKKSFGSPGPSVKDQVKAFEKLNAHDSPDTESSQDEETPKTPYQLTRMTRSKALKKGRKSGSSAAKTVILKKPVMNPFVKVKRLSTSNAKGKRRSGADEKDKESKNVANSKIAAGPSRTDDTIQKKKEELLKKQEKEEEAIKKKEEALKAQIEESKRKREEKRARAAATREAAEKLKQEAALRAEKDKEERKKILLEREEKMKEEQAKKRNLAAQKAAETEERRRQEEAARQARLREVAEEQKRAAALKLREQEEHAAMKRKMEEAKQTKKITKEPKKEVTEYKCTPSREERPLKKPKTEEDYGLEDASASDSSEDESNPKKEIPHWALSSNRNPQLLNQIYYPSHYIHRFMSCKKQVDLTQIFKMTDIKIRSRTSSAVWTSPLSATFCKK